jgi:hypothetical protein
MAFGLELPFFVGTVAFLPFSAPRSNSLTIVDSTARRSSSSLELDSLSLPSESEDEDSESMATSIAAPFFLWEATAACNGALDMAWLSEELVWPLLGGEVREDLTSPPALWLLLGEKSFELALRELKEDGIESTFPPPAPLRP